MRDVRNRIVHDYLPSETKQMYDDIMGPLSAELILVAALQDQTYRTALANSGIEIVINEYEQEKAYGEMIDMLVRRRRYYARR